MESSILREYFHKRVKERLTPAQTRRELHIHYREAAECEKALQQANIHAQQRGMPGHILTQDRGDEDEPLTLADLPNEALHALEDFDYFRKRYLGRTATPWQRQAADQLQSLLLTPDKEYVVVNCPPGSGKSTLFAHDIPVWLLCQNRRLRFMVGSYTERQAIQYIGRIRRTLTRKTPEPEAESTLIRDFGGFRPLQRDLWRVNEFIVAQPGETEYSEKEPSFAAYGYDSAFLGGRFDFVIWDDLIDKHILRTPDAIERAEQWYGDEAETRLEPGGLFVLQGQRLAKHDLYRFALDLKLEDGTAKYHHIVFRAHDDDNCQGLHDTDAPYWPDGCLLDPKRVDWKTLSSKMRNAFGRYRTVYQQEDEDPERSLIQDPMWIEGGESNGFYYPGCYDRTRKLGEWPPDKDMLVPVVTVDPSATKNWGCILWAVDPTSDTRSIIDIFNGPMTTSDFLDYSYGNNTYSGLLERWWQKCEYESTRLQNVIVESNAAQRWLYQTRMAQQWATQRTCTFIAHQTTLKKNDEELGVQSLRSLFEFGKIRLPGRGSSSEITEYLNQMLAWPDGKFDDLVMSSYFLEAAWAKINFRKRNTPQLWTPSWMKNSHRGLYERA